MIDHLVRVTSITAAKTAMASWVKKDELNNDVFRLPTWCDILPVDAYTALGTPAVLDTSVFPPIVLTPPVPSTLATGKWFIVSLDRNVTLPPAALAVIKTQGNREDGLSLPSGIVGLSTIWAGMTLK